MSATALPWVTTGEVELSEVACATCRLPLPVLDVQERQTRHASCGMPPRPTTRRKRT